ncbi:MAG TPA: HD domain-containing protein [Jatrophihabitans sp.]|nr:HD domain-containing protein [Jatrophihabitans sp.]
MQLADLPQPTTPAALAARAVSRHFQPAALANHCERSYLFAAALGEQAGLAYDAELLYVAAMLHDLGLAEPFDAHTVAFEQAGGSVAWVFAAGAGWPADRCERASEIIVRHMWPSVDPELDVEGYLLESATSLDIGGVRPELWPAGLRAEVVAAHPHLDLATEFGRCFTDQAARKPESRAAAAVRNGIVERLAANRLGLPD